MGIWDSLTILAGGAAKGYRQQQELNRQIVLAKRKALLEERQQAMAETAMRSRMALEASQMAENEATKAKTLGEERRAQEAATEGDINITEGGQPLLLDVTGQKLRLPPKLRTLQDPRIAALYGLGIKGETARDVATTNAASRRDMYQFRLTHPIPKVTGTPLQRYQQYFIAAHRFPALMIDPEEQKSYVDDFLSRASERDPEAFGVSDTTKTTPKKKDSLGIR